ncbi:MAG: potassium channel family protein [Woeseiaceae bacterium]|nr:potassium channel family protein [Woeseiaceae bacterium]
MPGPTVYVLIGAALVVITVLIHAAGTTWWLKYLGRAFTLGEGQRRKPMTTMRILGSTVLVLLVLHVIEIEVWAMAYLYLLPSEFLGTAEEAAYFSFVTFTTLGYGDITLPYPVRMMSGIEAINGIMLGGWSTALLFAVVQRTWQDMGRGKTNQ